MGQLMLINPRKRRAKRKTATSSKRRTYRKASVKSNPVTPIRRRRSALKAVRRTRRIRRNPIGLGGIVPMITDAAIGAGGAVAVNLLFDKLPLPLTFKVGYAGTATKAALALGLGIVGKKVLGNTAGKMAAGAMTVIAYDVIRSLMPVSAPNVAGLGYVGSGINAGYLPQQAMGEYVNGGDFNFATSNAGMGEYINGY